MGTLESHLYELFLAMEKHDKKREETILKTLSKVGMDAQTAKALVKEYRSEWSKK